MAKRDFCWPHHLVLERDRYVGQKTIEKGGRVYSVPVFAARGVCKFCGKPKSWTYARLPDAERDDRVTADGPEAPPTLS